eukprot:14796788-Alexandrium_andersonii.AAC.1
MRAQHAEPGTQPACKGRFETFLARSQHADSRHAARNGRSAPACSARKTRQLYIAGCPKCNPQSAQGPSALQFASVRNPPC